MKKPILFIYITYLTVISTTVVSAQSKSLSCPTPPNGYGNFAVQVPATLPINNTAKPGYQLVFDDEFDSSLSPQIWDFDPILDVYNDPVRFDDLSWANVPAPFNDNLVNGIPYQNYFIDPTSKDLKLRVVALDTNYFKYGPYVTPKFIPPHYTGNPMYSEGFTYNYSSATIITNAIFFHGYFEIEAKFPKNGASYPVFWFNNREEHYNYPYPDTHREIDVFDDTYYPIKSTYPFSTLFSSNSNFFAVACAFNMGTDTLLDLTSGFHIYACDWEADSIKFYLDNQLIESQPNTLPYDGRVQMILGSVINPPQLANFPQTGIIQGENDLEIKYARAWQKTGDLFSWYFINRCNVYDGGIQVWKKPGGFFATPDNYPPYTYAIETDYLPGTSYSWKSSDSSKLIIDPAPSTWSVDSFAENGSRCYFHGTTPGNYSIYLTASLPAAFGGATTNRTIPITILPDSLPAPTIHVSLDSAACNYKACIDTVPGATSYTWSHDGIHWSLPLGDMCPADFIIPPDSAYTIQVQALYISCNGQQLSSPIAAISGTTPAYVCDTATKKNTTNFLNLIKAYPSPSDGRLWIENDFPDKVDITLMLDTGALLRAFTLSAGEKIETDDLPQGMLILEAVKEDDHEIVGHKLLPVFRH